MFEISSERGKGEKMIDLLHDGGDVSLQHSVLKGLREVISIENCFPLLLRSCFCSSCLEIKNRDIDNHVIIFGLACIV